MNAQSVSRRTSTLALVAAALSVPLIAAGCGHAAPRTGASAAPPGAPTGAVTPAEGPTAVPVQKPAPGPLPGSVYYVGWGQRDLPVLRLTPSGPAPVLSGGAGLTASVSPDGKAIAYVDGNANVVVTDQNGKHPRTVLTGGAGEGYEPAWSTDSSSILAVRGPGPGSAKTPGIVNLATGAFTPLAHNPNGIHYLWSADGRHLGYATGTCQIGTANADGTNARLVPVLGDPNPATNPDRRRSCDPYSISPDGTRIAVALHSGDDTNGDIARDLVADAVIDTRTGSTIALPLTGTVTAILFQPNGDMLVRHDHHLTLVTANGTVAADTTEPTNYSGFGLLAYIPN
jgi:TolB protein